MMCSENLLFRRGELRGKYSFQYIKNPLFGRICAPEVGELILDDEHAKGEVITV